MPERRSYQVDFIYSASGDRFPTRLDTSHPLWKLFLESSCLSPTHFFRAFLSPPTYFTSPRPWTGTLGLAHKVAELLDSFRPGSYSYRPFKKPYCEEADSNRSVQNVGTEERTRNVARYALDNESRRRIYIDLGRPRPFYRRQSTPLERPDPHSDRLNSPLTLQNSIQRYLVKLYGLKGLRRILFASSLPVVVRDKMLTFLCEDFEEAESDCVPSPSLTQTPASYKVRSLHDGRVYSAIFATSEVDKAASNIWEEYRGFLEEDHAEIKPVLALVADTLTENVFFLVENEQLQTIEAKFGVKEVEEMLSLLRSSEELARKIASNELQRDIIRGDSIFVSGDHEHFVVQNPILNAAFRLKWKERSETAHSCKVSRRRDKDCLNTLKEVARRLKTSSPPSRKSIIKKRPI